jgi:hypothetical protein
MGCAHGQAIGDCLACEIDDAMRDVDPGASRDRLVAKAVSLLDALQAATRFTFKGPGDYFVAYYDAETDFWLVADRDGTVCGEHDERGDAMAQAKRFAAGETS